MSAGWVVLFLSFVCFAAAFMWIRSAVAPRAASTREDDRPDGFPPRARRQQESIVALATSEAICEGRIEAAAREITEAAANAVDVDRVSVWLFSDERDRLECVDFYRRTRGHHATDDTLHVDEAPSYFKAIVDERAIPAHDARSDPRTSEFREQYLLPRDIHSMLDAPIRVSGSTIGVVCFESVGGPRTWTADEASYAGAVADQFAQAVLNHQRNEYLQALEEAHDELEGRFEHRTSELRSMIQGLRDLYFRMDSSGTIIDYHAPDQGLLYTGPDQFLGKRVGEVLPEPAAGMIHDAIESVVATGAAVTLEYSLPMASESRDFEARLFPVVDGQVSAIVRDLTERNRTAESLRQSERLASIGTLAAGIAHEINNPLGTILLATETAQGLSDSAEDQKLLAETLERIRGDVRRAGRIVKSVLQFSRHEEPADWRHRSLREIVEAARKHLVEESARRSVSVEVAVPDDLPAALMSPTEMEQVFVNLLANAIEAAPPGSRVSVEARVVDGSVEVCVRDDGPGISAEEKARIFDPFFTTRQNEGGTGLGLSLSLGIVERHGGSIEVDSVPGGGTAITVVLPLDPPSAGAD